MIKSCLGQEISYGSENNPGQDLLYHSTHTKKFESTFIETMSPNSSFLDVGAHNGDTCITLAAYAKSISRQDIKFFAFEPSRVKANFISKISKENDLNIEVYNCAVGQEYGFFQSGDDFDEYYGCKSYRQTQIKNLIYIPVIPLDSMKSVFGTVGYLHIDVEGWESQVIIGAKDIINSHRPPIFSEIWTDEESKSRNFPEGAKERLLNTMEQFNYSYFSEVYDETHNIFFNP